MKKTILIIIGILVILFALAAFLFLLKYGAPKNIGDIFSKFTSTNSTHVVTAKDKPSVVDTTDATTTGPRLRFHQLTTRPVVGATFIDGGIRYAERGTGYVYDIMFSNGNETQVSNTTIPNVVGATFSKDGTRVAITTEGNKAGGVLIGSIQTKSEGGGSIVGKTLPAGTREVLFTGTSSVSYIVPNQDGAVGYSYNLLTDVSSQVFTIPLKDIRVLWGSPNIIYTTPSALARGYAYKVSNNSLEYMTNGGYGLMTIPYLGGVAISSLTDKVMTTQVVGYGTTDKLAQSLLPEKCTMGNSAGTLFCAAQIESLSGTYPDTWYKGEVSLNDVFWKVSFGNGGSSMIADPVAETGRQIDVLKIGVSPDESKLWFINKNDDTLWDLDLTE